MTYEEAIRVIESNRPTSGYTMLCEALDIAKKAIEKQIPKSLILIMTTEYMKKSIVLLAIEAYFRTILIVDVGKQ